MQIVIFHYEPSNKFYLGSEAVEDRRPDVGLPAHSTDVPPPLDTLLEGMIPIFNGVGWDVVPDTFWRPKTRELNYDAGRKANSYKPISLSIYSRSFPNYPSMPMLCNTSLVTQSICQRIRIIHEKFTLIVDLHKQAISIDLGGVPLDSPNHEALTSSPCLLYRYKLEIEAMVYIMRRVLDSLVQLSYLLTNYPDFDKTKTIGHNEIGRFVDKEIAITDLEKVIIGDGASYQKDETGFLSVINDLFNSFKHCLMHDESYSLMCPDVPTIVSYQAKRNNHNNEIIFHNHNAYHIMMGFQDNVLRILKNQKTYQSTDGEL